MSATRPKDSGFPHPLTSFVLNLVLLCAASGVVLADEFQLKNGSRIEGNLLNPDEEPRKTYEIELPDGRKTSLKSEEVLHVVKASEAKRRYAEVLKKMPPTAEGNWTMAEWCARGKGELRAERKKHLEQAVLLDPTHEKAQRALGRRRINGQWMERDEEMESRGFVLHKGRWRLPEEVALAEEEERTDKAQKQWRRDIRQWIRAAKRGKGAEVSQNLRSISDPMAASAIADLLLDGEPNQDLRHLYVEVLSQLATPTACNALAKTALLDPDEDTRALCLEKMPESGHRIAVSQFVIALKSNVPELVSRAGEGLQVIQDPEVIPHLIDALVTQHKQKISDANPGQIGASFGGSSNGQNSGAGLSTGGGGPKYQRYQVENRSVLEALLLLTPAVNFKYNQAAWRMWLAESGAPPELDLRRRD